MKMNQERNRTSPGYISHAPFLKIITIIYYNSVEEDSNVSCSIIYEKGGASMSVKDMLMSLKIKDDPDKVNGSKNVLYEDNNAGIAISEFATEHLREIVYNNL